METEGPFGNIEPDEIDTFGRRKLYVSADPIGLSLDLEQMQNTANGLVGPEFSVVFESLSIPSQTMLMFNQLVRLRNTLGGYTILDAYNIALAMNGGVSLGTLQKPVAAAKDYLERLIVDPEKHVDYVDPETGEVFDSLVANYYTVSDDEIVQADLLPLDILRPGKIGKLLPLAAAITSRYGRIYSDYEKTRQKALAAGLSDYYYSEFVADPDFYLYAQVRAISEKVIELEALGKHIAIDLHILPTEYTSGTGAGLTALYQEVLFPTRQQLQGRSANALLERFAKLIEKSRKELNRRSEIATNFAIQLEYAEGTRLTDINIFSISYQTGVIAAGDLAFTGYELIVGNFPTEVPLFKLLQLQNTVSSLPDLAAILADSAGVSGPDEAERELFMQELIFRVVNQYNQTLPLDVVISTMKEISGTISQSDSGVQGFYDRLSTMGILDVLRSYGIKNLQIRK